MEPNINQLCALKYLIKPSNFNETSLIDVVSTSLFKMQKGYKYFEKYMIGLEMAIRQFSIKIPELKFLLFIDDSIYLEPKLYDRIRRMNNGKLIVMHFSCPIGISTDRGHIELFGALVRLLPFFTYSTNFTRNVICIDADIELCDLNYLVTNYHIFSKSKSKYQYDTNMFYEMLAKWSLTDEYTILAGRQMCKYKFPLELLTDYLQCMKSKTCEHMDTIKSLMNYAKYDIYPYGIDEYFLNHIVLPYMKNHNIRYSASVRYAITAPLYYLKKENTIAINSIMGQYLAEHLNIILGNVSPINDYHKLINQFDQLFYPYAYECKTDIDNQTRLIAQRYYDFILELWQTKNYQVLPKSVLKKIFNSRDFIVKHNLIIYLRGKTKKYLFPGYLKL